jgi:membrane protein DedA with SNARE-associated domain
VAVLGRAIEAMLGLRGTPALAIVFAVPALEASAFLGFLFPGELALLLGGVLAFEGRISLPAAIAAGVAGAIVGDTTGYLVGRRWGRRMLRGALGRFITAHHLDRAQQALARRGGPAVFVGRFTAALRVLIPGLAGMSRIDYRTFALYNVAGAVVWGSGSVLLGYLAGESWRQAERVLSRAGHIGLLVVVVAVVAVLVARRLLARRGARGDARRDADDRAGDAEDDHAA